MLAGIMHQADKNFLKKCSIKPVPGTYALILQSFSKSKIQIGRWRQIDIVPGYYVYVGSAFGPGGVLSRVSRHFKKKKPKHWHIDYLRNFVAPLGVWYTHEPEHFEHRWARTLYTTDNMHPIQGFGCSDCKCYSHLFWSPFLPDFTTFPCNEKLRSYWVTE